MSDLCIPRIGQPILLQPIGRPILGIYKSLTGTWNIGNEATQFHFCTVKRVDEVVSTPVSGDAGPIHTGIEKSFRHP